VRNPAATSSVAAIPVLTTRVTPEPKAAPAAISAPLAATPVVAAPSAAAPVAPVTHVREATSAAVLDEKILDQIRELQRGVPNLLSKVAELYLENSALLLGELRSSLNAKDAAGLARSAHALKSTSFNTGAKALAEMCGELESIGLEARIEQAGAVLDRIVHEHARVARALDALRAAA
jgi:HPt (histidine-containing phosphotransfer) domain-containing protein